MKAKLAKDVVDELMEQLYAVSENIRTLDESDVVYEGKERREYNIFKDELISKLKEELSNVDEKKASIVKEKLWSVLRIYL